MPRSLECLRAGGRHSVTTARTVRTVEKGDWKLVFLKELQRTGIVGTACKKAKISRSTAYKTRDEDVDFAAAWDIALDDATDNMEQEAWRRGVKGTVKPVYQGKEHVGDIREYSDTLLIFMLKGIRPDKYRERTDVHHSGKIDVSKLSDDELRAITEG